MAYCVNGQSELCRLIRGPASRHKVGTGSLEKSTTVHQFKGADHIGSSIKDKAAHRTIAASLRARVKGNPPPYPQGETLQRSLEGPPRPFERSSGIQKHATTCPSGPLWAPETLRAWAIERTCSSPASHQYSTHLSARTLGCPSSLSDSGRSSTSPPPPRTRRAGPGMTSAPRVRIRVTRLRPRPPSPWRS